jgi:hypothetical protein
MDLDDFKDELTTQQAIRDIQAAVDRGEITWEEVQNAPIVEIIQTCDCDNWELNDSDRCTQCLTKSTPNNLQ